jgi:hypothetical protein
MESANNYEGLDPLAANLVRRHARRLVRSGAIPASDLEDAEQDLMVHALAHIGKHDERLGHAPAFYDRVIGTKARHIAEHRLAMRRRPKAPVLALEHGLSAGAADAEPGGISEEQLRRVGPEPMRSEAETLRLRIDVRAAIERLPPVQREIAARLLGGSVSDAARELGVARSSLYPHVAAIRAAFAEAGLDGYVRPVRDAFPPFPVATSQGPDAPAKGGRGRMDARMVTTYSMWSLFRNCRKAVEWRHVRELAPIERDPNLGFGTVVHKCLELWHAVRRLGPVLELIDGTYPKRSHDADQRREWHLATAMMRAYTAKHATEDFEVVALERVFEGEIVNPATRKPSRSFVLKGKVDGIVKRGGEYFLLEHKTASQMGADYLERLWTDFQITLYAHYVEQSLGIRISGIVYNILVKAKLQQSRGETEAEFEERRAELIAKSKTGKSSAKRRLPETDDEFQTRLAEKYAEPDMLHRELLYISREQFEVLQAELWELTQAYLHARRRGVFYQNTSFCFHHGRPCPFFALCRSNGNPNVVENFYRRAPANEELRAETDTPAETSA